MQYSRRALLRAGGALGLGALAGCSAPSDGSTTTATGGSASLGVDPVASGFVSPVDVAVGGGETLVADQVGVLYRLGAGGRERVLDLRTAAVNVSGYDERGLLGVALHPDFPESEEAYVYYSAPRREGTPDGYDHTSVLAAFDWADGVFDPGSERVLLEIPEPQSNHNGGALAFGPDGYLYVGVGDGGGANDAGRGHVSDWYEANAGGNGQDTAANRLGSVLRIDVDAAGGERPYGIPEGNPLADAAYPEQYAWGFRNPWRLSFDELGLLVADVGQNRYEEVNLVARGGNYGWNVREGRHCFAADAPSEPPESCPSETPEGTRLRDPVIEYPHRGDGVAGIAVVGGYVYRGEALDGLRGAYVFADWRADGGVFVATPEGESWPTRVAAVDGLGGYVTAFGRDADGELLVCTNETGTVSGSSGSVVRLIAQ
ncbi:PQQ-dependent sugar dehydrogenase [Halarchaeum sp. CBA1220]|uniref:PQQ-dependent sugar dehydrogenase n=1 Tax=Halarchaeum sp. CBA1220 TaxID=1853682 RepID=UPI000F3A87B7|nr:PQQ-dependent sugar dehydrogenase [Halarchaeum sp. CBA1220]QLC32953.1 PQQ-dependent sugar dehydrogenase [Halarchaeum sp. CBA1220]